MSAGHDRSPFVTGALLAPEPRDGSAFAVAGPQSSDREPPSPAADKPDRIEPCQTARSPVGLDLLPLGRENCKHCGLPLPIEFRERHRTYCGASCAQAEAQPIVSRARERWGAREEQDRWTVTRCSLSLAA